MAIVTDGLDAATIARWREQITAQAASLEAVWDLGQPDERAGYLAWCAVGNAANALKNAIWFLDTAAEELAATARADADTGGAAREGE